MNLLSRLLRPRPDPREELRPAWNGVVALARSPHWYARLGVADSREGRFDMLVLVLALVLLRMERAGTMGGPMARLTELFVADMDGQLRQSGIGDPTVGKHVRKLVTTLGGRLGALREALPQGAAALAPVLERNMTVLPDCDLAVLVEAVLAQHRLMDACAIDDLLAGQVSTASA